MRFLITMCSQSLDAKFGGMGRLIHPEGRVSIIYAVTAEQLIFRYLVNLRCLLFYFEVKVIAYKD